MGITRASNIILTERKMMTPNEAVQWIFVVIFALVPIAAVVNGLTFLIGTIIEWVYKLPKRKR